MIWNEPITISAIFIAITCFIKIILLDLEYEHKFNKINTWQKNMQDEIDKLQKTNNKCMTKTFI